MVRVKGPDGVLVVDKPTGKTSHDIVAAARRHFGTRSVGHAGTLDPMASGVLLLLFGEATKLSPFLTADEKRYAARVAFGRSTDTLDAEGRTTDERELPSGWLQPSSLEASVAAETARTEQVPPAYSAIKIGGERAHRLSRQGIVPELAPRPVSVRELSVVDASDAGVALTLCVSKGYFVRSLARDLCERLGVPGHLAELRRLASGRFGIDEAASWPPQDPRMLSVAEAARRCLPVLELAAESVARARQGKPLSATDFRAEPAGPGPAAWLGPDGEIVAIGRAAEPGLFRVVRGFADVGVNAPLGD